MDQDKVNPFVGNTEAPAGGAPVSDASASSSSTAASGSTPSVPVNPYAPAGAPYAPGSNTPAPDFATPYSGGTYDSPDTAFSNDPAVPNTGAYTSFSPAPSQDPVQFSNVGPEKPKLFTKKFIIFAIIGLVLIIVAVVAGVIVQNNRSGKSASSIAPKDPTSALYVYMNYLISGVDSTKKIESAPEVYYVATELSSVKKYNPSITNAIVSKWNDFYNLISSSSKEKEIIKDYGNLVDLFDIYGETEPLVDEDLLSIFTKEDSPESYIEKYYSSYTGSASPYAKSYGDTAIARGLDFYNAYKVYSSHNCVSSETLDKSCLDIQVLNIEEIEALAKFNRNADIERKLFSQDVNSLTSKVWNILYMAEGEGEL